MQLTPPQQGMKGNARVTGLPTGTAAPPGGFCEITALVLSPLNDGVTVKFPRFRMYMAFPRVCPMTFGTGTICGVTVRLTVVPLFTTCCAGGVWPHTMALVKLGFAVTVVCPTKSFFSASMPRTWLYGTPINCGTATICAPTVT